MILSAIQEFTIDGEEYGTLVEGAGITASEYKIHIEKFMPHIAYSTDTSTKPETYDPNIFINDSSNKPSCKGSVNTQGFLTIEVSNIADTFNSGDVNGNMSDGNQVLVSIVNNNIRKMFVSKLS